MVEYMRVVLIILMAVITPFLMSFSDSSRVSSYADIDKNYSEVTDDPLIVKALDSMDGTTGEYSKKAILGFNLTAKPVKIYFKNLGEINPGYASFDALGWRNSNQLYIYINNKHRNSPPEALGSLLSHEAVHQDQYNSLDEETIAWTLEAKVWLEMKERNPDIAKFKSELVIRENTLGGMLKDASYNNRLIRAQVEGNSGYFGLPQHTDTLKDKIKFLPVSLLDSGMFN